MSASTPKTIAQDLVRDINALFGSRASYCQQNELEVARLSRETQKLMQSDAAVAHCLRVLIEALLGKIDSSVRHFNAARKLNVGVDAFEAMWIAYMNLGFMSDANALTPHVIDPTVSPENFKFSAHTAHTCGSIATTCAFLDAAERMNFDLDQFPVEQYRRAHALMNELSLTDAIVASVLDVAGSVLRENRLFYLGQAIRLDVADAPIYPDRGLYFTFDVAVTPNEAAALYFELAERICQKFEHLPEGVHVSFRGLKGFEQ